MSDATQHSPHHSEVNPRFTTSPLLFCRPLPLVFRFLLIITSSRCSTTFKGCTAVRVTCAWIYQLLLPSLSVQKTSNPMLGHPTAVLPHTRRNAGVGASLPIQNLGLPPLGKALILQLVRLPRRPSSQDPSPRGRKYAPLRYLCTSL